MLKKWDFLYCFVLSSKVENTIYPNFGNFRGKGRAPGAPPLIRQWDWNQIRTQLGKAKDCTKDQMNFWKYEEKGAENLFTSPTDRQMGGQFLNFLGRGLKFQDRK
jgi:hypothetical protein